MFELEKRETNYVLINIFKQRISNFDDTENISLNDNFLMVIMLTSSLFPKSVKKVTEVE